DLPVHVLHSDLPARQLLLELHRQLEEGIGLLRIGHREELREGNAVAQACSGQGQHRPGLCTSEANRCCQRAHSRAPPACSSCRYSLPATRRSSVPTERRWAGRRGWQATGRGGGRKPLRSPCMRPICRPGTPLAAPATWNITARLIGVECQPFSCEGPRRPCNPPPETGSSA